MQEIVVSLLLNVIAGLIVYILGKWLDSLSR